jgi:hypothetical protein
MVVHNFVLQFGRWQPEVDEDQPRLTLHRRLGTPVGVADQFPDFDDAAAAFLLTDHCVQFACRTSADMKRSVKCGQGSLSPQSASNFDHRPRRGGRESALHPSQPCTDRLMHHQTVDGRIRTPGSRM